MSNHYYGGAHLQSSLPHQSHATHGHHGRNRRGPRVSSQNTHRQYKAQARPKEVQTAPDYSDYMARLEAAKSFDLEDDMSFCPFHLLTEDDVGAMNIINEEYNTDFQQLQSIHSATMSERGSASSGSPDSSPLQHQIHPHPQPNPSLLLSPSGVAFIPGQNSMSTGMHGAQFNVHLPQSALNQKTKLHQPMAQRIRNPIPIVDPSTRAGTTSPPQQSVSPPRMHHHQQQYMQRHW